MLLSIDYKHKTFNNIYYNIFYKTLKSDVFNFIQANNINRINN